MVLFELLKLVRVFLDYLRIEYLWHHLIMPLTNRNGISWPVFHIGVNSPDPFNALLRGIAAVTLLGYVSWLLLRRSPESTRPRLGGEKQLLMAMLDAGGSITPVDAALQTSLTVDEAEEILTRFADRGHLLVESRDGALFYALPGRRLSSETWTH